jgi:hypothetical protein
MPVAHPAQLRQFNGLLIHFDRVAVNDFRDCAEDLLSHFFALRR